MGKKCPYGLAKAADKMESVKIEWHSRFSKFLGLASLVLALASLAAPATASAATYCPAVSTDILGDSTNAVRSATDYIGERIEEEGADAFKFAFVHWYGGRLEERRSYGAADQILRLAVTDLAIILMHDPHALSDPWLTFMLSDGLNFAFYAEGLPTLGMAFSDKLRNLEYDLKAGRTSWIEGSTPWSDIQEFIENENSRAELLPSLIANLSRRPKEFEGIRGAPEALKLMRDQPGFPATILENGQVRPLAKGEKIVIRRITEILIRGY